MILGPPKSTAFSLVEVTLALGVAAVAVRLICEPVASNPSMARSATEQAASSDILTAVANDLRATPAITATSMQFAIAIPPNPVVARISTTLYFDSTGQPSMSLDSGSRYRLVSTFLPNGGGRTATLVDLRLTWPAAADPTEASTGAAELFVALDRN